jgi:hypothetical protein
MTSPVVQVQPIEVRAQVLAAVLLPAQLLQEPQESLLLDI